MNIFHDHRFVSENVWATFSLFIVVWSPCRRHGDCRPLLVTSVDNATGLLLLCYILRCVWSLSHECLHPTVLNIRSWSLCVLGVQISYQYNNHRSEISHVLYKTYKFIFFSLPFFLQRKIHKTDLRNLVSNLVVILHQFTNFKLSSCIWTILHTSCSFL